MLVVLQLSVCPACPAAVLLLLLGCRVMLQQLLAVVSPWQFDCLAGLVCARCLLLLAAAAAACDWWLEAQSG